MLQRASPSAAASALRLASRRIATSSRCSHGTRTGDIQSKGKVGVTAVDTFQRLIHSHSSQPPADMSASSTHAPTPSAASSPPPFTWADAPPPCSVAEASGPLPLSNWVIPSRLCVGGYPCALSVEKAREYAEVLTVHNRFTCVVNLMEISELTRFRPYAPLMSHMARNDATPPYSMEFLHYPIPDGGVPSDPATFLALVAELVRRLRSDRATRVYIHCWGGHGRTGTLLAVLLACFYREWSPEECLRLTQQLHGAREFHPDYRSPETGGQMHFVREMIAMIRAVQRGEASWTPPTGFEVSHLAYEPLQENDHPAAAATTMTDDHADHSSSSSSSPSSSSSSSKRLSARERLAARAAAAQAAAASAPAVRAGRGSGVIIVDPFGTASTTQALASVPSTPLRNVPGQGTRRISREDVHMLTPAALDMGGGSSNTGENIVQAAAAPGEGVGAGKLLRRCMLPVEDSIDNAVSPSASSSSSPAALPLPPPRFTLMQFNMLADSLCNPTAFPHTDPAVLRWEARRDMLLGEITGGGGGGGGAAASYAPDILCLEEVDVASFERDLRPALESRGFGRGQVYFMQKQGGGKDGVVLAVRDSAFRVRRVQRMRIMDGMGQVVILAQLDPCTPGGSNLHSHVKSKSSSPRRLYVAATHLKAKDGFEGVRLRQVHAIMMHLQRFITRFHEEQEKEAEEEAAGGGQGAIDVSPPDGQPSNPPHASTHFTLPRGAAVIFAGDLNDTPDSAAYRYIVEGSFNQATMAATNSPGSATQAAAAATAAGSESPVRRPGIFASIFNNSSKNAHSPSKSTASPSSTSPTASSSSSTSSSPLSLVPPVSHSLWLHSLYNRLWRSGGGGGSIAGASGPTSGAALNHVGALYTTSKRRAILIERCIDYVFYSPATLRPTGLLSIPQREQVLPAFMPAANYPSDHLAIAGQFEWKHSE